ncbi:MAG: UDP-N-acetylmuramoyl-L-alanyl-D-glutamate--2,6-diaminopimelate ligase [Pseudohongiellaceae bacterium]
MNTAEEILHSAPLAGLVVDMLELPAGANQSFNVEVTGIKIDSRQIKKGDLFIACFGRHHDARDYIAQAIDSGAAAVVAESGGVWQGLQFTGNVPVVAIDNLSSRISEIAGRFFNHPSHHLQVMGITGTNGKTSCSQFIAQALTAMRFRCGVIGTLGYGPYNQLKESSHTTPDAVFTQSVLAQMVQQEINPVVMEVSSVGLHQHRVKAVRFDTAIYTNLTRDHLDYHNTMESYAENKRRLFAMEGLRSAIINLDDPYALTMLNAISRDVDVLTYSASNPIATVYARDIQLSRHGYQAEVVTPLGSGQIKGQLIGYFNFSNVLAVLTTLISYLGHYRATNLDQILAQISALKPVNGRMEIIGSSAEITAIVDYAHTPDGLKCALTAVRDHFHGNIWLVFGCGGNRDKGKRPMMGEIAAAFANRLIIADDNPRNESGEEIIQHIMSGVEDKSRVTVIRDRAQAIEYAIVNAAPGDIVLVAGKGHETYQDIAGRKMIFSDANQVRLALQKRIQN